MKLKSAFFAVVITAVVFLAGCGDKLVYKNGAADIKNAGIVLSVPEGWTVKTENDAYNELYKELSDEYASVKELKQSFEDSGERLVLNAHSSDGSVAVLFTELDKGEVGAADLLRTVHDTTVFDFRSSDFFTESSFGEQTWGGVSGVMSVIRVSEGEDEPALLEEREFCFEYGELIFSLKIHIMGGREQEAEGVEIAARE